MDKSKVACFLAHPVVELQIGMTKAKAARTEIQLSKQSYNLLFFLPNLRVFVIHSAVSSKLSV